MSTSFLGRTRQTSNLSRAAKGRFGSDDLPSVPGGAEGRGDEESIAGIRPCPSSGRTDFGVLGRSADGHRESVQPTIGGIAELDGQREREKPLPQRLGKAELLRFGHGPRPDVVNRLHLTYLALPTV